MLLRLLLVLGLMLFFGGVLKEPRWWLVAAVPKKEQLQPRQNRFPLFQGCPPLDAVGSNPEQPLNPPEWGSTGVNRRHEGEKGCIGAGRQCRIHSVGPPPWPCRIEHCRMRNYNNKRTSKWQREKRLTHPRSGDPWASELFVLGPWLRAWRQFCPWTSFTFWLAQKVRRKKLMRLPFSSSAQLEQDHPRQGEGPHGFAHRG